MERYHRGERLQQVMRLKVKRKNYWGTVKSPGRSGMVSQYPAICSCWMCGNSRKYYGNGSGGLTVKELSDREFIKLF